MGVRRLCIGLYHDVAHMSFVYCVRPGRFCCIRRDGNHPVLLGAHAIRRSTLYVLPYPPIYLASPARFPLPWYFLSGVGVWLERRAERLLCRGHGVAGLPCRALATWVLPPLAEATACVWGSFWRGIRVHTLRLQGLQSICQLAGLDQL